jgi:hypothetical protein
MRIATEANRLSERFFVMIKFDLDVAIRED